MLMTRNEAFDFVTEIVHAHGFSITKHQSKHDHDVYFYKIFDLDKAVDFYLSEKTIEESDEYVTREISVSVDTSMLRGFEFCPSTDDLRKASRRILQACGLVDYINEHHIKYTYKPTWVEV